MGLQRRLRLVGDRSGASAMRNRARCRVCREVIESKHRHDFQVCKCWRESKGERGIAVDGGQDYTKRCGRIEDFEGVDDDIR
jgi:hypothetical protein